MKRVNLNLRNVVAMAICLVATTMFSACDKDDENGNNTEQTTGGLFDIKDSEITVEDGGDLSALTDNLKKGIGGRLGSATLSADMFLIVNYDVERKQLHDLMDYYVANCGTVTETSDFIDDIGAFDLEFDWGSINATHNSSGDGSISILIYFL